MRMMLRLADTFMKHPLQDTFCYNESTSVSRNKVPFQGYDPVLPRTQLILSRGDDFEIQVLARRGLIYRLCCPGT